MKMYFSLLALCILTYCSASAQGESLASIETTPKTLLHAMNDTTTLSTYTGTYVMKNNPYVEEINVMLKDGQLLSLTPENEEILLQPTEERDTFYVAAFSIKIIFTREQGSIKGIKAVVQGKEIEGTKK